MERMVWTLKKQDGAHTKLYLDVEADDTIQTLRECEKINLTQ